LTLPAPGLDLDLDRPQQPSLVHKASINSLTVIMDFSLEDSQNAAPGQPTMAEQQKLNSTTRRADTQSVTKRSALF
jgi:hypothetical protein